MDVIVAPKPKKVWRNINNSRLQNDKSSKNPFNITSSPLKTTTITEIKKREVLKDEKEDLITLNDNFEFSFDIESNNNDSFEMIAKNDINFNFEEEIAVNELFDIMTNSTSSSTNLNRFSSYEINLNRDYYKSMPSKKSNYYEEKLEEKHSRNTMPLKRSKNPFIVTNSKNEDYIDDRIDDIDCIFKRVV